MIWDVKNVKTIIASIEIMLPRTDIFGTGYVRYLFSLAVLVLKQQRKFTCMGLPLCRVLDPK